MLETILAALTFGFTAGIKPGPLGVYVLHQTLHRGYLTGLTTSLAPFISDGPMIVIAFLILRQLQHVSVLMAAIALCGAAYLLLLAWRMSRAESPHEDDRPSSFLTAVKINLLNPIAWMFWMTVGGFYLVKGSLEQAMVFLLIMLATLATTKFLFAASIRLLGKSMIDAHIVTVSRGLSLILIGFAIKLVVDAYGYLIA